LSADGGELIGPAVRADLTVTFTALKPCLVFPPAHKHAGDVIVADIGNSPELVSAPEHFLSLNTPAEFPDAAHRREQDTHKGDYGKVLIVGGSRGKSGAAAMAGQAALRCGAGLVTVATPSGCLSIIAASMPELMTEALEETTAGTIANVSIAALLEGIAEAAPGIDWTRVMYAYPGYVTDRLIETMAARPQITHYLDMPLQHGHPMTLRRMRRPANITWVHQSIAKMRAAMPDLALRSTFIVGYPGETEEEFQALLDFVEELKFDRLGAFTFSYEPGTESAALGDPIPEAVKQERKDRLMALQQRLSLAKNQALVGKTLNVLVEGQGDGLSIGRTYRDAPEIDGVVVIDGEAPVGEMVPVRISGALAYDLSGTVETASAQAVTAPLGLVNG